VHALQWCLRVAEHFELVASVFASGVRRQNIGGGLVIAGRCVGVLSGSHLVPGIP
jgi:hypothetical protein